MKEIFEQAISRAEIVRVRNALNPMLWLTAVATPVFLLFAWLADFESITGVIFTAVAILPVLATIVGYYIFLFSDRDRLQSEEFVLEHRKLQYLERKGGGGKHQIEKKPPIESYVESDEAEE
ncbi:hypothetical protein U0C82_17050 [Fulvimarina sp. 2208YS6-2-32]|uniref:Uncharacterized protein n=1 Tax=Fulvimarina uroteuthidis TaxID=3098149 RepID=A0ABU5I640_9HYPH|nr:hypothetical protein [Fulvimarina sp. 2208YS6-2-32]MDY8110849.1 hypothetical protein [Fulvimarina sp. 2208YS6-2-32]